MTCRDLRLNSLWLLFLFIGLAACARLPAAPAGDRPLIASADELLQQLQERAAAVTGLKARGNVAVTSPQKNYSGNILLTAVKPDRLRVDILNFWGQSLVTFVNDGQEMKLLVYGDSKLYRGPATPANLSRFLPVVISQEDFLAALTGHLAFPRYEKPVLLPNPDPAVYFLELTDRQSQEKVKLTVEAKTLHLLSAQWFSLQGQETLRAEFSNFLLSGGVSGPSDIRLTAAEEESQVRVRYRDVTFNAPVAAEAWDLPLSATVRVVSFGP